MMRFNFCSRCGSLLESARGLHHSQKCVRCGTEHWQNAKPCAGVLIEQRGHVLLARRGVEPFKDCWDIPGGFLLADEHPEAAATREALEETGLRVRITALLGIYIDRYGDTEASNFTLNVYYTAKPIGGIKPLRAQDDVSELRWFVPNALPERMAFKHETQVLADWKRQVVRSKE